MTLVRKLNLNTRHTKLVSVQFVVYTNRSLSNSPVKDAAPETKGIENTHARAHQITLSHHCLPKLNGSSVVLILGFRVSVLNLNGVARTKN